MRSAQRILANGRERGGKRPREMAGIAGVGLSWSSNLSLLPPLKPSRSAPRRVFSVVVRNAVSVEKQSYSLQKSEEIFNAAKVPTPISPLVRNLQKSQTPPRSQRQGPNAKVPTPPRSEIFRNLSIFPLYFSCRLMLCTLEALFLVEIFLPLFLFGSLLAEYPGVITVFPNRGYKLHTTRSWDFLGLQRDGRVPKESLWTKARFGEDTIIGNLDTGNRQSDRNSESKSPAATMKMKLWNDKQERMMQKKF